MMAEKPTSTKISLQGPPVSAAALPKSTQESTSKANALLQQNHNNYHVLRNPYERLHNHLSHHILAIYALGATSDQLQYAYDNNVGEQTAIGDTQVPALQKLSHTDDWDNYLGNVDMYHTFLEFYQTSIEEIGWQEAVKKYIFSEKAVKNGMPERLVSGNLHPWLLLGYGIEFEQPAIVAEALAQTAVHDEWPAEYLKLTTAAATLAHSQDSSHGANATIVSLFKEAHGNDKLRSSTKWTDPQKNKAVYANAMDEMVALASKWYIPPTATDDTIARGAAELASATAYICSATPRLDRKVKFDFFLMHTVTSSLFVDVWMRQKWLGNAEKSVLLNYFGWMVVNFYVSRGCADIDFDQVRTYIGKHKLTEGNKWESLAERVNGIEDDGHVAKTVRALMNAAQVSSSYVGSNGFEIPTNLFENIAEMAVDAAEDCGEKEPMWVFSTGHAEAWDGVPGPRLHYS